MAWDVRTAAELTPASFELVLARKDQVRVAAARHRPGPGFSERWRACGVCEAGIALEAMDTGAACRTYNVLLGEGRPVAAALMAVD